jgi:hypothetical protein
MSPSMGIGEMKQSALVGLEEGQQQRVYHRPSNAPLLLAPPPRARYP